jgi:hypothetical protein
MDALLFRTRVSVLWLAVAIALSGSLLLHLFLPGAVEEMVGGEMEGETLTDALSLFFATLAIIPLVMAGVALLVGDRVNHSVNLIAGVALGLFGVFAVVSHLLAGDVNVHVLMVGVAVVGSFLIAGLSLAGLRHPTPQPVAPAPEPSRYHEVTTA